MPRVIINIRTGESQFDYGEDFSIEKDLKERIADIVKCLMENRVQAEFGVKDPEEILINFYLDLSKLAGVKPWYPKGSDEPSKTECLCDFMGIDQVILNITIEQMLEAWCFYKSYKKQNYEPTLNG